MCSLKLTRLYYRAKGGIIPYRILIGIDITTRKMSEQEQQVNELHSLSLLMYKQQQDMMKDMDQLRGRVSAQEQKTQ